MVSSLGVPRPQRIAPASEQAAPAAEKTRNADVESWMDGDDDEDVEEEEESVVGEQAVPLNSPEGICVDKDGWVYVTDTVRSCVRKVTPQGKVLRFAGTDAPGYLDGALLQACFRHPRGICVVQAADRRTDKNRGTVLVVCDTENHCMRMISDGHVTTVAGCAGLEGHRDGPASQALFNMPWAACAIEGGSAVAVCDHKNHCIRKITVGDGQEATVSTVFGKPQEAGDACDQLRQPWSICEVRDGIVVGDKLNQRVVMFDLSQRAPCMVLSSLWPDSMWFAPRGMAFDGTSLYMSNSWQSQIWRAQRDSDATGQLRLLDTIAGTGLPDHRDGKGDFCEFFCPAGVAVDSTGSVYVADHANHCVRKCREMRAEEVKQQLAKFVLAMRLRSVRAMMYTWRDLVFNREPLEPLDVVLALAMGTNARLGLKSQLRTFSPDALRSVVAQVARVLGWRVVRTRKEVAENADDTVPDALSELIEKIREARSIFDQFDKDGGGSIDATEVLVCVEYIVPRCLCV
jgi:sugar lactone lactonase YvrE